jgi:prepilin-type processing-associated H-X9-DG protein
VLVAACLLLSIGLLIPPVISHLQYRQEVEHCKNNLNQIGMALIKYTQVHDNRKKAFVNVADPRLEKRNKVAGIVMPVLVSSELIDPQAVTVRCPGVGSPLQCSLTVRGVKQLSDEEFRRQSPRLICCYAYSLGYYHQERIQCYSQDHFPVPIMADRPPFREKPAGDRRANSPNHAGRGQNVLFSDGHVAFLAHRTVGGDDIFLNRDNQVAAGKDPEDIVLGMSEARPVPLD